MFEMDFETRNRGGVKVEKAYNINQTATLLCVKPRTVRKWIKEAKIYAEKIAGTKRWIVFESEIKRLRGDRRDAKL